MNVTSLGTLNFASWPRQCSISSSAVAVGARREHDDRDRHLAPPLVGASDHRDLEHRGVLVQHPLDLGAGDVLAARHDHVLQPVDDVDVAVVVLAPRCRRCGTSRPERRGGRVGIAPVAREDLRARAARPRRARRRGPARRRSSQISSSRYRHARPTLPSFVRALVAVEERVARDRLGQAVGVGEPRRRERRAGGARCTGSAASRRRR